METYLYITQCLYYTCSDFSKTKMITILQCQTRSPKTLCNSWVADEYLTRKTLMNFCDCREFYYFFSKVISYWNLQCGLLLVLLIQEIPSDHYNLEGNGQQLVYMLLFFCFFFQLLFTNPFILPVKLYIKGRGGPSYMLLFMPPPFKWGAYSITSVRMYVRPVRPSRT